MREVTLRIESNVKAPSKSRSHLAPMKPTLEPRYEDVLLIVSELVSNSVRHSKSTEIDLTVSTQDGRIRVEVSDDGPGFTHETPRGEGMGLAIVEKLSERWGLVSDGRFTVWAELSRTAA
jgi:signal transduction histidine kinase